ncbi:MAG TPA: L,D-transpeptidase family protein [Burkholderiales bacterium]|nr:L,D-transpeptidase family protein [Burkholderiales bacterium]
MLRLARLARSLPVVLPLAFVAAAVHAMGGQPPHAAPPLLKSSAPQAGPEAMLIKTLFEIGQNRLDTALAEIDKLLAVNPNFRLAHLIKGDLLLARARPISTLGNADGAPERIDDLRAEALARLARYQQERPRDRVPKYLLQLQPEQKYALVVDTTRSTLYVFENHNGEPQYLADYYVSSGKNGVEKLKAGDKKTPLGVYHVVASLNRTKLSDFYGIGAYPISYPNEWDRRQGRDGSGIWLHGTPSDTYSRPPRASDGCVVLANQDLATIGQKLQIGLTPVIIAEGIDWVAPAETHAVRDVLVASVEQWRHDWESLDTRAYLKHYSAKFYAGGLDFEAWSKQKTKINAGKSSIKVALTGISAFLYPGKDTLAVVTFDQDYSSSNLSDRMKKRQYWVLENGTWKIAYEGPG